MSLVQQFDNDEALTLGTLGGNDLILQNSLIDGNRAQGFRIVKSQFYFNLTGKTQAEGPIMVGIAANVAANKVELIIENDPQNVNEQGDERGRGVFVKALFMIGLLTTSIPGGAAGGPTVGLEREVNYGKNGWSIPEGQALSVWAYNMQSGALTAGTVISWFAEHFGVWLRD